MSTPHIWRRHPDANTTAVAAADYLAARIRTLVDKQGLCRIALPGGRTPAHCLQRLSGYALPWSQLHCYLGDERCLPVGDEARNDSMLADSLWSRAAIPAANIHPIPAELGPVDAARAYTAVIEAAGRIDIALLGMGEDGHTASLFPGNRALSLKEPAVPVFDAPKPPPQRVSLSIPTLQGAVERIVLITGAGKADALRRVKAGEPLPVNLIGPLLGFTDAAADPPAPD